jgi:hypothetical protein
MDDLYNLLLQSDCKDNSLLYGNCGIALTKYIYCKNKDIDYDYSEVENILQTIQSTPIIDFSFCCGLIGQAYYLSAFNKLEDNSFFTPEFFDYLNQITEQTSLQYLDQTEIEYYYGLSGNLKYLLHRTLNQDESASNQLSTICKKIIEKKKNTTYLDFITQLPKDFGLAHGYPGFISVLNSIVYSNVISPQETTELKQLISELFAYMDTYKDATPTNSSYYPKTIEDNNAVYARLAWCYGDLGVAISKSNVDPNTDVSFITHLKKQSDQYCEDLPDSCTCHGKLGVAYLFRSLSNKTKLPELHNHFNYFFDRAMREDITKDIRFFNAETDKYEQNYTLMDGAAGCLMCLMGISGYKHMDVWDDILLLN